jgi:hypothetical protein
VAKRVELSIDEYAKRGERPAAAPAPMPAMVPAGRPEATTTLQARVPFALADRLRDLARARSRGGQKVTVNALLTEAVERFLQQEGG